MVGIFGLAHKSSPSREPRTSDTNRPPPPYEEHAEHDSRMLVATTTTQVTTTTTETTTHFFSLPLWRRRLAQPPPTSTYLPGRDHSPMADEVGIIGSSRSGTTTSLPSSEFQLRNKDLPPTPGSEEGELLHAPNSSSSGSTGSNQAVYAEPHRISSSSLATTPGIEHPSVTFPPQPIAGPSNHNLTTHFLARAALGLGLMAQHAASVSSLDVHNVAFVAPEQPKPSAPNPAEVRRVKSYGKLANPVAESSVPDTRTRRRTRGLSLGPFQFPSVFEGKGKEKERVDDSGSGSLTPPKVVSRKSSFFSRKRHDSSRGTPPSPSPYAQQAGLNTTLPAVPPISPFAMDLGPPRPLPSNLRRRHSERSQLHGSPEPASPRTNTGPSSARIRSRRPSTADSPRPRSTHVEPSRATFLASPPPLPAHLPAPSPPVPAPMSQPPPPVSEGGSTTRTRSKTTPSASILPRLSLSFSSNHALPAPGGTISGMPIASSPVASAGPSPRQSFTKNSVELKPKIDEESPEVYLERLTEAVNRAEIASILAAR
jgi:hypothetical protein